MDIDKVYRLAGGAMKRFWKLYVSKPFRDYNVENRAQKTISKDKPQAAQWHDATKAAVKETKKYTDSAFQQYNKFDDKLADRLKSVRVTSKDEEPMEIPEEKERDSRMPTDRIGMAMPYVFRRPEVIPQGKITVFDALDMLLSKQKEGASVQQMASTYSLAVEDVEKVVQYVDVFKAASKVLPPTDVKYLADRMTEDSGLEDTYDASQDHKKRALKGSLTAKTETSKNQQQQQLTPPSSEKVKQERPTKVASKIESK